MNYATFPCGQDHGSRFHLSTEEGSIGLPWLVEKRPPGSAASLPWEHSSLPPTAAPAVVVVAVVVAMVVVMAVIAVEVGIRGHGPSPGMVQDGRSCILYSGRGAGGPPENDPWAWVRASFDFTKGSILQGSPPPSPLSSLGGNTQHCSCGRRPMPSCSYLPGHPPLFPAV